MTVTHAGSTTNDVGIPYIMQATAKTAMRRVLCIRGVQGAKLVPPTAVAGGDEGFVFEFKASDNNNSG